MKYTILYMMTEWEMEGGVMKRAQMMPDTSFGPLVVNFFYFFLFVFYITNTVNK